MSEISRQLKAGIARAKFEDADIEAAVNNAIEVLDNEITSAGYEPGTDVEQALAKLESTLNTIEDAKEHEPPATTEDEDEDDEFAGFDG